MILHNRNISSEIRPHWGQIKLKPWVYKLPHLHALWIWSSRDLLTLFLINPLLITALHLHFNKCLFNVHHFDDSFTSTLLEKNQCSVFSHSLVLPDLIFFESMKQLVLLILKKNFSTMWSLCCRQIFHLLWRTGDLVLFLRAEPHQTGAPCTGWQNSMVNFQIGAD